MKKERTGLRVKLLGGFETRLATGAPMTLPTRKAQALLAYLAVRPGHAHPRDKLAALLWGDRGDVQARDSLRHTLVELRRILPERPPSLVGEGRAVALDPAAVEVDVVRFETLVEAASPEDLAHAAELYQGDLLEGFALREAAFEEWLLGERERLRELALGALRRLLDQQTRPGETVRREPRPGSEPSPSLIETAIRTALRLVALDATQEVAHRALMRLYVQQGRRAAALRQYQTCVSVLQRELGTEPEAATRQVYQEIVQRRDEVAPPSPRSSKSSSAPAARRGPAVRPEVASVETPLIGRSRELETLRQALDEASWGRGRVVAILGEAGVGKSRLVAELATQAAENDVRALVGRGHESEQILPFGPWVDALRAGHVVPEDPALLALEPAWRAELARLFPEMSPAGLPAPSDDARRLFESVTQLVRSLATRQAVLLVLEDVHWADDMTLRLLAYLGRRVAADRVLVVATAREEELADADALRRALAELRGEGHVTEVVLSPLSRPDTSALVRFLAAAGSASETVARLEEQAWAASEGNPFVVVETVRALEQGAALPAAMPIPERVRQLTVERLERLSARSRQLLAVAAVIGREFDFRLLQRAAGATERDVAEDLEELVRRQVLHGVGERFDFTHDRVHEIAYERILLPRRRVLHAAVMDAIERAHGLEASERLFPGGVAEDVDVLAHHALRAESWAKAVVYLRQAGATAFTRSANQQAVAYFERALETLRYLPASREHILHAVDLCFDIRTALVALGALDRVLDRLREAERLISELDDPGRRGWVSVYMAHYFIMTGQLSEARAYAERARTIADHVADFSLRVAATHYAGWARLGVGDYRGAEGCFRTVLDWLDESRETERCGLTGFPAVMARWLLAELLGERGAFDEALAHAEHAVRIAERLDHAFSRVLACWAVGSVHRAQGQLGDAVPPFERALDIARDWNIQLLAPHVMARLGMTYAGSGRVAEGRVLIEEALRTAEDSPTRVFHAIYVLDLGEACLLAGHLPQALAVAERGLTLARERGERGSEARALHLLGEIHRRSAPPGIARAEGYYGEALALAQELGMEPLVARCHAGLGGWSSCSKPSGV